MIKFLLPPHQKRDPVMRITRVRRFLAAAHPLFPKMQLPIHRHAVTITMRMGDLQRGPGPMKRGDHGRRHTAGWIDRGDGDGGEPDRSPSGRLDASPAVQDRHPGLATPGARLRLQDACPR